MAYCGPRGIPRLHFLGGPAQWTQHDRDAALWWLLHERQRCPSCRTRAAEWDPGQGGDPHAYHAEITRCPGCAALENGRKVHDRKNSSELLAGETWTLTRQLEVVSTDATPTG